MMEAIREQIKSQMHANGLSELLVSLDECQSVLDDDTSVKNDEHDDVDPEAIFDLSPCQAEASQEDGVTKVLTRVGDRIFRS